MNEQKPANLRGLAGFSFCALPQRKRSSFEAVRLMTTRHRRGRRTWSRADLPEPGPRRSAWSGFVNAPGLVLSRVASTPDEVPSEILFGGEGVVGAAAERDVVQAMLAAPREGQRVM